MDPITAKGVAHTAGHCIEKTITTQHNPNNVDQNWQQAAARSFGYSLGSILSMYSVTVRT